MNKMIKMTTIVVGVGTMLSFAGCGEASVRDQFEASFRETSKLQGVSAEDNGLDRALKEFDAATPAKQNEMLKQMNEELARNKK